MALKWSPLSKVSTEKRQEMTSDNCSQWDKAWILTSILVLPSIQWLCYEIKTSFLGNHYWRRLPIKVSPHNEWWIYLLAAGGWMDPPLSDSPHYEILDTKYHGNSTLSAQIQHATKMLLTYSFFLAYHRHKMLEVSKNQTPAKTFPRLHFLLLLVFARLVCRLKCHILFIISFSFLLRMLSLTCAHVRIRKSQLHIFVFLSLCLLSFYLYVFFISA